VFVSTTTVSSLDKVRYTGGHTSAGNAHLALLTGDVRFGDVAGRAQVLSGQNEVYAFVDRKKEV